MTSRLRSFVFGCALLVCAGPLWAGAGMERSGGTDGSLPATAQAQGVPADLRPLLTPPPSEMRFIVSRYALDRQTLSGNYAGEQRGGRAGRGGRGDTAEANLEVPLSPNRTARLTRFDLSWQAALENLDAVGLSAAARANLDELKAAVRANLRQLDAE
ncbi:MAG TPA: hypothetical protein VGD06_11775, partial [Acidobacteriota bacterium]